MKIRQSLFRLLPLGIGLWGVLGAIFWSGPTLAQEAWVKTGGPIGGLGYDVRILSADKNTMFVTDNWSGVNKSLDGGRTWSAVNEGIAIRVGATDDGIPIFSLTVDPNDEEIVWAGTFGNVPDFGVFKSTDGGETWTMKINGIGLGIEMGLAFRGFTIQRGDSNTVYAQAEVPTEQQGREFNRTKGRIYKTTDGGENWQQIWEGDNLVRYLIIDPNDPQTLYASTGIFDREAYNSDCAERDEGGVGVLKSTDGGATWDQVNNGITDLYIGSLRMHPSNSQILFAAAGNNACSEGTSSLFKTTDGGESWSAALTGNVFTTVNFSPSNPDVVYTATAETFYRSDDGGETWDDFQRENGVWGPDGVRAGVPIDVTVDPDDPMTVYTNNYGGGVFKSTDGGETWIAWSKGYTGAELHAIEVHRDYRSVVYTIGRSGPFISFNGGLDWRGIATGDAANIPEWYDIAIHPQDADIILMSDEHQGVIFRSTDGGEEFEEVLRHPEADAEDPNGRQGFKTITFAPSNPDIVYAGISLHRGAVEEDPTSPSFGTALYLSEDAGEEWERVPSELDGRNVAIIAIDPTDAETAYAGTGTGFFKTENRGEDWSTITLDGETERDIRVVAIDPTNPSIVYAGENENGVWKSTDGGESWALKNAGLEPNPTLLGLIINPVNPSTLYLGDWSSGAYKSTDGGESWTQINTDLSTRAIKAMAISTSGENVYAATHGEGAFRLGAAIPLGTITGNVTDAAGGTPIVGATVTTDPARFADLTDANGAYTISDVTADTFTYTVTASADGYESSSSEEVTLTDGENRAVSFQLVQSTGGGGDDDTEDDTGGDDEDGAAGAAGCQGCFMAGGRPAPLGVLWLLVSFLALWLPLKASGASKLSRQQTRQILSESFFHPSPFPADAEELLRQAYPRLRPKLQKTATGLDQVHFTYLSISGCAAWAYVIAEAKEGGSVAIEFSGTGPRNLRPTGGILESVTNPDELAAERLRQDQYLCEPD